MPKSTRTFIGLPIPEAVVGKLALLQEQLGRQVPGVRWSEPAGFHVTLNFLGDVIDTDLHAVCKAAVEVIRATPAFDVSVQGVGAFPNPSRPRVIWSGIDQGGDSLASLHHDLATAVAEVGYRSDEGRFNPHLTLGRFKNVRGAAPDLTTIVEANRGWIGGSFRAKEMIVYASNLGPDGPSYTALSRAPLLKRMPGLKT